MPEQDYVELTVHLRSKTTFGTDTDTIRVWPGQKAQDVAGRVAQGYGATVEGITRPDGTPYTADDQQKKA